MEIIEPSAELLDIHTRENGIALLKRIEWCGRISHRSEEKQSETSWEPFIKKVVLSHGDWSIVEHASASVQFIVDRGCSHEIVRHRLASYTQESTRFVNYAKRTASFIKPKDVEDTGWELAIEYAYHVYLRMLEEGESPQTARSVLPNAMATKLIMTCNLRNWRHFLLMRTTKEAQPQLREVCTGLLQQFQAYIPLVFEDIVAGAKQSENLAKAR